MAPGSPVISSRFNQHVKQLRAAFAGNRRTGEGLVAIEGEHLLEEALRSGIQPTVLFATPDRALPGDLPQHIEVIRLSEDVFASAVETRTPQGIAALIKPPSHTLEALLQGHAPLVLMAAGLQDPGNLGTLIRSAEAFGASGVLTTSGTVSEWNQKALRASVGSVFRLPVVAINEEQLSDLAGRGLHLYAATGHVDSQTTPAHQADLAGPAIIMIGNEGAGLSDRWLSMANSRITIPCPGPVESLNAAIAGSLLLYEASLQRRSARNMSTNRSTGSVR